MARLFVTDIPILLCNIISHVLDIESKNRIIFQSVTGRLDKLNNFDSNQYLFIYYIIINIDKFGF